MITFVEVFGLAFLSSMVVVFLVWPFLFGVLTLSANILDTHISAGVKDILDVVYVFRCVWNQYCLVFRRWFALMAINLSFALVFAWMWVRF